MRVGVLAYLLHAGADYRAAGVSTYAYQLLRHLPAGGSPHHFLALHGTDAPPLQGVCSLTSPWPTDRPLIRIPWEQCAAPLQLRARDVDVVHGTVNVLSLACRRPGVVTVHDLSFLRVPDRFARAQATYLRVAVAASVRRARKVIAVSESTRRDLIEILRVPDEKIVVVYSGVTEDFGPLPGTVVEAFRQRCFDHRPFLLHVGTLEPRKNLDLLIRAFAALRATLGLPHVLALVGARGWMYESLFRLVQELKVSDDVRFVDYVPPVELPLWYNAADLFVYPSAYEGFGLPVLEAMACGTPTITSASSALRELARDACLTVAPGSEETLQVAISRALTDQELRSRLRQAGLARAGHFSWQTTARETIRVYEQAAEAGS